MKARPQSPTAAHYDPSVIVDAPEHYALARALGMLTWDQWDHGIRPLSDRVREFVASYPPLDPMRHTSPGLALQPDGMKGPALAADRVKTFLSDGGTGSLNERLSRYGLKVPGAIPVAPTVFAESPFREVVRRRNHRLRVLHGGVDVAPDDMDAAKAELLDRDEKRQAAAEVRAARTRLMVEIADERQTSLGLLDPREPSDE